MYGHCYVLLAIHAISLCVPVKKIGDHGRFWVVCESRYSNRHATISVRPFPALHPREEHLAIKARQSAKLTRKAIKEESSENNFDMKNTILAYEDTISTRKR